MAASIAVDSDVNLVDKIGGTSIVWKYFGFAPDDISQSKVICKVCFANVATLRGNTTNLRSHLQHKHPKEYDELRLKQNSAGETEKHIPKQPRQLSVASCIDASTPYSKNSQRHKDITKAVTSFLAKDMVPVYTVKKSGF